MKRAMTLGALGPVVVTLLGYFASSCAPTEFPSASLVSSVRILASSAEPPYAMPGSAVRVSVLAYDGRAAKSTPMNIYWLPFVCKDPPNDAYYACFQQFAAIVGGGAGDAGMGGAEGGTGRETGHAGAPALVTPCSGAGASGTASVPSFGGDLTPLLPQGDCATFVMPADAVTANPNKPVPPTPYGLAILFNIACAGHLELLPLDPANLQSPPIGCFDAQHNRLGPNDYVFGFTRVYAYDALQNANPKIDSVEVNGQPVNLDVDAGAVGFELDHCPAGSNCEHVHIGPVVPPSSQEPNPLVRDVHGNPLKEQIWAEFFSTLGSFTSDARLLYDPATGAVGSPADTDSEFESPDHAGNGTIWIIVHDNRGGATWATVPVRVR
jgi:hypothetical protein